MDWIFFAILAPALYAVVNFFDKFLIEKRVKDPILLTIFSGIASFIAGLIILLITGFHGFTALQILVLVIAGVSMVLANIPYFKAMQMDDASRIIPLFQVVPIYVLVLSYLLIGETLTGNQAFAFCLILVGGFLLSIKQFNRQFFRIRKSFWYMMLSSFLFALPFVLFKLVLVENQSFWPTLGWELFGEIAGVLALLAFYVGRFKKEAKNIKGDTWALIASEEGTFFVARLCTSYATALVSVSLVSVLGGFQSFFVLAYGLILSMWFPHILFEDIKKSTIAIKIAAIVIIFIGVWLISN